MNTRIVLFVDGYPRRTILPLPDDTTSLPSSSTTQDRSILVSQLTFLRGLLRIYPSTFLLSNPYTHTTRKWTHTGLVLKKQKPLCFSLDFISTRAISKFPLHTLSISENRDNHFCLRIPWILKPNENLHR
jgi:hypothetical protein